MTVITWELLADESVGGKELELLGETTLMPLMRV